MRDVRQAKLLHDSVVVVVLPFTTWTTWTCWFGSAVMVMLFPVDESVTVMLPEVG